jgi:hypothetical protein
MDFYLQINLWPINVWITYALSGRRKFSGIVRPESRYHKEEGHHDCYGQEEAPSWGESQRAGQVGKKQSQSGYE